MPTFIDESGDMGPRSGSSRHFRLAAAWFESQAAIERYEQRIVLLRAELGVRVDFEFHHAELNDRWRSEFFAAVADLEFRFAVCSFAKAAFDGKVLTKEWIREQTVGGLAKCLHRQYLEAESRTEAALHEKIVFDQCSDAAYERSLKEHFRALASGRGDGKPLIGHIKPRKSRSDPCLQLADMICGATSHYLDGKDQFYKLFSDKQIGLIILPENASRPDDPVRTVRPTYMFEALSPA